MDYPIFIFSNHPSFSHQTGSSCSATMCKSIVMRLCKRVDRTIDQLTMTSTLWIWCQIY